MTQVLRAPLLLSLLVLAVAGVRMWRDPWKASDLFMTPDSVEYAVAAQRFATLGTCDLEIEGVAYPPRYPPWFSAGLLAPAYVLAPGELGAGAVPVLLVALTGVLAAWSIGRRLAGEWGGVAAAALLTASSLFGTLAREILTDAPAAALTLWVGAQYLGMSEREPSRRSFFFAGLLCAAAAALRTEAAMLVLPFALLAVRGGGRTRVATSLACLLAAPAVLAAATALYQQAAFGDWRRTGYMFWCPVPCDYPQLTFSLDYVQQNLATFDHPWVIPPLVWGALGTVVLLVRRSVPARRFLLFGALGVVPGSLLHLVFFFPQARFHLPLVAIASVLGGAGTAALVPDLLRDRASFVPALLALVPLALTGLEDLPPTRRIHAAELAQHTPEDAVIITAMEPVYLEPFLLRGTARRAVPISREVEYASKAVAWRRIDPLDPPARGPLDHRAPGLFRGGAKDVCAFTADEKPEQIAEWVRQGTPVFLDTWRFVQPNVPPRWIEQVGLVAVKVPESAALFHLVPRP